MTPDTPESLAWRLLDNKIRAQVASEFEEKWSNIKTPEDAVRLAKEAEARRQELHAQAKKE